MLSRVADNLYWMSRYLERAEHAARLTDINLNLMLEGDQASAGRRWARMLRCLDYQAPQPEPSDAYGVALKYSFEAIVDCIIEARENARQVREQISSDMWEQLNRLFHEVKKEEAPDLREEQPVDFLHAVIGGVHLFQGITDSTMNHGEGWQFIRAGRFIERVFGKARLLDCHFRDSECTSDPGGESSDHMEWIGLLRCSTAFEAYCKVYGAGVDPNRVAEFLLLNSEFPHSLRFASDRIQQSLETIQGDAPARRPGRVMKLAGRLRSEFSFTPFEEIMENLPAFLQRVERQCFQIHSAVYQTYINYPVEAALGA